VMRSLVYLVSPYGSSVLSDGTRPVIVLDVLAYRRLNVLRGLRITSIPLDTNYGEGSDVRLLIGMLSESPTRRQRRGPGCVISHRVMRSNIGLHMYHRQAEIEWNRLYQIRTQVSQEVNEKVECADSCHQLFLDFSSPSLNLSEKEKTRVQVTYESSSSLFKTKEV